MALGLPDLSNHCYAKNVKREIMQVSCKAMVKFNKCSQEEGFIDGLIEGAVNLLMKKAQLKIMAKHICNLQQIFRGYTIWHTLNVIDFEGQPISSLTLFLSRAILLKPLEVEKKALNSSAADIVKEYSGFHRKAAAAACSEDAVSFSFNSIHLRWTRKSAVSQAVLQPD